MQELFVAILNMSITAGYVIVAVLLARLLLRRAPKKYTYLLWSAVAFRLCCPVSFSSAFSLLCLTGAPVQTGGSAIQYVPPEIGLMTQPQINIGIAGSATPVTLPPAAPETSANPMQIWLFAAAVVWGIGMVVLLGCSLLRGWRLRRRMRTAVRLRDNIYEAEQIPSPFILGLLRPRIYIPFGLDDDTRRYVLAHERYHLRHGDHWVKALAFCLLVVHWFNPLCWAAFCLMSQDMEMRCDEAVLAREGDTKAYSLCLLSFAANRRFPAPGPLAFGESGAKARIRHALNWKKPRLWLSVLAAVLCVGLLLLCVANPAGLRLDLEKTPIVSAATTDLRWDAGPLSFDLSPAQIEELTGRLRTVDTTPGAAASGFSPCFYLQIRLTGGDTITASSYDAAGTQVVIESNGRSYTVCDDDFCAYLSRVCSGGDQAAASPVSETTCYTAIACIFVNPLSSTLPTGDPGLQLALQEDSFVLTDTISGEVLASAPAQALTWQELTWTAAQWEQMTLVGRPDIEGYQHPRQMVLSDRYTLLDMDGTIWLAEIHGNYIWQIFTLVPDTALSVTGGADGPQAVTREIAPAAE